MPEEKETREFSLRQMFPWVELFRAFQIALEPYKLVLAAMAIVVLTFGWWLLSLIFNVSNQFGEWPPNAPRGANPYMVVTERPGGLISREFWVGGGPSRPSTPAPVLPAQPAIDPSKAGLESPKTGADATKTTTGGDSSVARPAETSQVSLVEEIYSQPPVHLEPLYKFIMPVAGLFRTSPARAEWWYLLFGVIMTLAVWAIFGGAITRIAAVQVARNEKIGIVEALRFSISKFPSFFAAPLIPFAGVAAITVLMIVGGFIFHIPWMGEFVASLLWPLPLLGGLVMALILIGLVGWPLMYATVSAEGSDSFDALSRCYAYVFQRPWHYLFYSVIALLYGVLVIFFVVLVTSLFVYLAKWAVSLTPGLGWRNYPVDASFYYAPTSYDWQRMLLRDHPDVEAVNSRALEVAIGGATDPVVRDQRIEQFLKGKNVSEVDITRVLRTSGVERDAVLYDIGRQRVYAQMNNAQVVGAVIVAFWLHLIFLMMLGFAYSYFWSVSTIMYFLLRKKVDDTDMDEVYLEEELEEPYPTPSSTNAPPRTGTTTLPMVESPRPPEAPRATVAPPAPPAPAEAAKPPVAEVSKTTGMATEPAKAATPAMPESPKVDLTKTEKPKGGESITTEDGNASPS